MNTNTNTKFVVKSAFAAMPSSCWGTYRRVAVLEIDAALNVDDIKMISDRARGVVKVVATWEKCNVGTTSKCAYQVALVEAQEMADRLNA